MNFKKFFLIHELEEHYADILPKNLIDLVNDDILPFNQLFGKNIRIIEPLKNGLEYKIEGHLADYVMDTPNWSVYKKKDVARKNPIRIGKALNKRKQELEKLLTNLNQYTLKEIDDIKNKIQEVDELLKTTNLQKQIESNKTSLFIVYSRAPIDVARMSDFSWTSCHSPGNEYFKCAMADAMNNAGIAYLITEDQASLIGDNLNKSDLFYDQDRGKGIRGLTPVARIRLRAVADTNGNILCVPSPKIYSNHQYKYTTDFVDQVITWVKKQDVSDFQWDDVLLRQGGSYEDYGYRVVEQIKSIWGKDVSVSHDSSAEDALSDTIDEFGFDLNQEEENAIDALRDEVTDDKFLKDLLDDFDERKFPCNIDINLHGRNSEFCLEIDGELEELLFKDYVKKEKNIDNIYSWNDDTVYIDLNGKRHPEITVNLGEINLHEYVDVYGRDQWSYYEERLYSDVSDKIKRILNSFVGRTLYFGEDASELQDTYAAVVNRVMELLELKPRIDLGDDVYAFEEKYAYPAFKTVYSTPIPDPQFPYNTISNFNFTPRQFRVTNKEATLKEKMLFSYQTDLFRLAEKAKEMVAEHLKKFHQLDDVMDELEFRVYSSLINAEHRFDEYRQDDVFYSTTGRYIRFMPEKNEKDQRFEVVYSMSNLEIFEVAVKNGLSKLETVLEDYDADEERIEHLDKVLANFGKTLDYHPDQYELDLSDINRNMSEFDDFIKTVVEGLDNQGVGGLANRAKNATATAPMPQPVNQVPGVATPQGQPNQGTAGTQYAKNANPASTGMQQNTQQGVGQPNNQQAQADPNQQRFSGLLQKYYSKDPSFEQEYSKFTPDDHAAFTNFILSQQQPK